MEIHEVLNFCFSSIIMVLSFLLFYTVFYYKKFRLKNETLFAEIFLYQGILFGSCIFKTIISFFGEDKREVSNINTTNNFESIKKYIFGCQHYLYNWTVAIIIITRLFYNIELYITFQKPIDIAKCILHRGHNKIFYEILALCLSILYVVLESVLFGKDTFSSLYEKTTQKKDLPFFISFKLSPILCLVLIMCLIILMIRLSFTKQLITKGNDRILFLIFKDYIILILELCFISVQIILMFVPSQLQNNYVYYMIISYIAVTLFIIEYFVELIGFAKSTFCVSMVRESIFGSLALAFNNEIQNEIKNEDLLISGQSERNDSNNNPPQKNIVPNINNKEEDISLILDTRREEIYIEEHLFEYSEAIITIIFSSMLKVFNSQIFNEVKEIFFLDFSTSAVVSKKENVIPIVDVFPSKENGFNEAHDFEFIRNNTINHYKDFEETFASAGISQTSLNVKITSFFTEDIIGNISSKNISLNNLEYSFLSHLDSESFSLLKINMKDNSYLNSKTFTLKTNDKKYFLEIMYLNGDSKLTNEKNSQSNTKVSSIWKDKIKKYSAYLKTNPNSFLPTLIGVFTIQINKLTPMLIFISRNSLYESIPKSNLKYWQLIRFDKFKSKRIAGLKEIKDVININNFCVDNEENEQNNKQNIVNSNNDNKLENQIIMLKNINEFIEILTEDVNNLQSLYLLDNLSLLMMYYELDESKQNKRIDKTDDTISNDAIAGTNEIGNNRNEFDFLNSHELSNSNHSIPQNVSTFSSKMVINGYEGQYEEYKCVCFFMFDNLFLHDNKEKINLDWQPSSFVDKVISHFSKFTN